MDNSATMRRAYELLSKGDIDGFGDLMAEGFIEHDEVPGLPPTKEGVKELFRGYLAAFPDFHMEAVEIIASGDKTVARVKASGTQKGEFMGLPPSAVSKRVVGLRPGEKMHESLWEEVDEVRQCAHPRVMAVRQRVPDSHRMAVRIVQSRCRCSPGEVDDIRFRSRGLHDLSVRPDRDDETVANRQAARAGA